MCFPLVTDCLLLTNLCCFLVCISVMTLRLLFFLLFYSQEVVRQSILTNQIPRAQAVLRRRGLTEQRLSSLRTEGLRQVFSCLQQQDLSTATSLLVNMVRTCR